MGSSSCARTAGSAKTLGSSSLYRLVALWRKAKAQAKPRAGRMVPHAPSRPALGSGNSLVGLQILHDAPEI